MNIKAIIAGTLGFLFITFVTVIIVVMSLGTSFLTMEDEVEPSEAIIILSGDEKRLEKGVDHYLNGDARYVILSNSTNALTTRERAEDLGVEADYILEEPKADSTMENALYTKTILEDKGLGSAIIVTSDYHMRRTRMTFEEIFSDSSIDLYYSSSASYAFEKEGDKDYRIGMAAREYVKLGFYWIKLKFR